jgi:hypothetical protein
MMHDFDKEIEAQIGGKWITINMCSSDNVDVGGRYDSMVPQGTPHPQFHKPIKIQNNEKHI